MLKIFELLGITSIALIILLLIFLPLILTLIVGVAFANWFGFTGLYYYSFILLFYLIITTLLGAI